MHNGIFPVSWIKFSGEEASFNTRNNSNFETRNIKVVAQKRNHI